MRRANSIKLLPSSLAEPRSVLRRSIPQIRFAAQAPRPRMSAARRHCSSDVVKGRHGVGMNGRDNAVGQQVRNACKVLGLERKCRPFGCRGPVDLQMFHNRVDGRMPASAQSRHSITRDQRMLAPVKDPRPCRRDRYQVISAPVVEDQIRARHQKN